MRELDDLLMRWLDSHFDAAPASEICAFEALLALPDPEIAGYLLSRQSPPTDALVLIVRQILQPDSA